MWTFSVNRSSLLRTLWYTTREGEREDVWESSSREWACPCCQGPQEPSVKALTFLSGTEQPAHPALSQLCCLLLETSLEHFPVQDYHLRAASNVLHQLNPWNYICVCMSVYTLISWEVPSSSKNLPTLLASSFFLRCHYLWASFTFGD